MQYDFTKTLYKGEYGSIIIFSNKVNIKYYKKYAQDNYGINRSNAFVWCIRGVTESDKVCNAIINAAACLTKDKQMQRNEIYSREPVNGYILSQEEKELQNSLKKRFHKRMEKIKKRQEKIHRKKSME